MTLKISISGVRGVWGESLTDKVVRDFASAFAAYLKKGTVVIGRDPRASGERIKDLFVSTITSLGIDVIYLGIAPTPTVQLMVKHLKADGGVVITASHNPGQWNGIKFVRKDGIFLNEAEAGRLIHIYNIKTIKAVKATKAGKVRILKDPYDAHISKILDVIDVKAIRKRKFKVVLDSCNGAGSIITVELLKKLGCDVIALYTDVDRGFPHNPEPVPENLADLCRKVKETGADIGLAQDADADRLALVTEKGEAPGEENTLAIAVDSVLSKAKKGKKLVVVNLSTSMMSDDIAARYGAEVLRTKIGEVNVAELMKKKKGLIGGEGNGGVMYPAVGYNRDSLAGIGLILDALARSGKTLSEVISGLPRYEIVKNKIECGSQSDAARLIEKFKGANKGEKLDTMDGVKVIYKGSWVHVRPSNTEPVIRIIAEAGTKKDAESLVKKALNL